MDFFGAIFGNPIIRTALVGWFLAQFFKICIDLVVQGKLDIRRFIGGSGGMPSSHTCLVVSTCVAVYYREGPDSTMFALSLVMAAVVMYDALGVRRAAGEQAKVLNALVEEWDWTRTDIIGMRLKELLGHTPLEVVAGAVLGVLIAYVMNR